MVKQETSEKLVYPFTNKIDNMQLLTNGNMLTRSDYDYMVESFYCTFDAHKSEDG